MVRGAEDALFGKGGLTTVKYLGVTLFRVSGKVTEHDYVFTSSKATQFADKRDVPGLLSWTDSEGKPLFEEK